jgi:hypothetical protein
MTPDEVARLGVRVYSEQNIYRSEYEVMRGWLQKQGEKYNKNWQDRLFVLYQDQQDSTLLYYKKANDMKTRGTIVMSQVTDIYEGPPRCIRGENIPTIGLEVPGRTYRLSAATFEEHRQWLRALREAMDTKKRRAGQDLLPNGESQLVELTLETMPELIKLFDRFNTQFRHLLRADDAIGLYRAHRQLNRMRLLYAAIVHYGEEWHDQFQQRLLTCVYGLLRVPLDQPDLLDAIVYLAEREQMQPRFENELVTSLDTLFDEEIEEMEQAENLGELLQQCSTITARLRQVQDEIVPVFPESYNIMGKYVNATHRCILLCIMNFVERVGIDEMHMIDALELISWSCDYRTDMAAYGLSDVGEKFDKVERALYLRFRAVVQTQMSSWINNLVNMEATLALEESEDIRRTSAPESLLVMIRGQLKLAEDKLRGYYLRDICCRVVGFLSQYCDQKMEVRTILSRIFHGMRVCVLTVCLRATVVPPKQLVYDGRGSALCSGKQLQPHVRPARRDAERVRRDGRRSRHATPRRAGEDVAAIPRARQLDGAVHRSGCHGGTGAAHAKLLHGGVGEQ